MQFAAIKMNNGWHTSRHPESEALCKNIYFLNLLSLNLHVLNIFQLQQYNSLILAHKVKKKSLNLSSRH